MKMQGILRQIQPHKKDLKKSIDVFINKTTVVPHKGTIIEFDDVAKALLIKTDSVTKGSTPGFKIILATEPGQEYFVLSRAKTVSSVRGNGNSSNSVFSFLYVENDQGKVLVPRIFKYLNTQTAFNTTFKATSNKTFVGILFSSNQPGISLKVTQFEIRSKTAIVRSARSNLLPQ
jgi:hypothetical protein